MSRALKDSYQEETVLRMSISGTRTMLVINKSKQTWLLDLKKK